MNLQSIEKQGVITQSGNKRIITLKRLNQIAHDKLFDTLYTKSDIKKEPIISCEYSPSENTYTYIIHNRKVKTIITFQAKRPYVRKITTNKKI